MPLYRYRAVATTGQIVTGTLEAPTRAGATDALRRQGHVPIAAAEVGKAGFRDELQGLLTLPARKPSFRALTTATQELAALLGAGLDLDRSLATLGGLQDIKSLHPSFAVARQRVRDGASLADALSGDAAFSPFYVNMVRAGERGGSLDRTFAVLADYLARTLSVREAVSSALVYPAVLVATAGLSIVVILGFVLPEFAPLFAESGRQLPFVTRLAMGLSSTFRDFWWAFALGLIAAVVAIRSAARNPVLRAKIDTALLKLPVLGELLLGMEVERFCRTLGTLLKSGVALPEALTLSSAVLWNHTLRDAIAEAAVSLREGEQLSSKLKVTGLFPALTLDLIQIGEETGQLDEMLLKQADLDAQRLRHALDRLLALLVPTLTIGLGFVVAGLIASMLVAVLSVNDLALQ
ncbi:MAG: type II secretion system F family protein [Alphaproteobacteria bacterium]|nr:type II secretion system F family protein [Alphaproteobacteria bacterium]